MNKLIQLTEFDDLVKGFDLSHHYNTPLVHLKALWMSVKGAKPNSILELGSYRGFSAAVMMCAAKATVATLVCVYPSTEIPNDQRQSFLSTLAKEKGIDCQVDCRESTAKEIINQFKESGRKFDYIYHDAEHGVEKVPEFLDCWEILNKEGVLAIHDYEMIPEKLMKIEGDKINENFFSPRAFMQKTDSIGKKIAFFLK